MRRHAVKIEMHPGQAFSGGQASFPQQTARDDAPQTLVSSSQKKCARAGLSPLCTVLWPQPVTFRLPFPGAKLASQTLGMARLAGAS